MQDTAEETRMEAWVTFSYEPRHMDVLVLAY